jgi:hypothetical protein
MSKAEMRTLRKQVAALQAKVDSKNMPKPPGRLHLLLANPFLQVVSVLIALAVAFSGKLDTNGTQVGIVIAFLIGAFGIYSHQSRTFQQKVFSAVLIFAYGFGLWEFNRYLMAKGGPLTQEQRELFTKVLKLYGLSPDYTELTCPDANEAACVYAATFIPLFQRGGWKIDGPYVQRVKLGRATDAIVIIQNGPPLVEPQNPDVGVWTKRSLFDTPLSLAFKLVGIQPEHWNAQDLPVNKMRVYFGSAPKR